MTQFKKINPGDTISSMVDKLNNNVNKQSLEGGRIGPPGPLNRPGLDSHTYNHVNVVYDADYDTMAHGTGYVTSWDEINDIELDEVPTYTRHRNSTLILKFVSDDNTADIIDIEVELHNKITSDVLVIHKSTIKIDETGTFYNTVNINVPIDNTIKLNVYTPNITTYLDNLNVIT